jgi:hypothetical protein
MKRDRRHVQICGSCSSSSGGGGGCGGGGGGGGGYSITLACKKKPSFCGKNRNRWVLLVSLC